MIIYIDIDETICFYEDERSYPLAKPNMKNIAKANALYQSGHTVVYWTARGATSGIDWTLTTKEQLKKWGAHHHELKMGKPHYDLFIDDKAMNALDWK